jgi:hypothetical protein
VNILGTARFKLEGKNHLGDQGIDGIILKWILEKQDGGGCSGLAQNRDLHQPLVNMVLHGSTKFPKI